MVCFVNNINTNDMLQVRRSHKALSLNMCMLCSKNSETKSHLFCIVRWLGSYGISFFPCLVFCGFAQLLWTVSLGMRKKLHFGKLQDLLFYGVYGWKGMLEFLNRFFS